MDDREAIKASEDSKQFDILGEKIAQVEKHICQFMAEARDLRGLVEDACDHKQIVKDMMESVEHLKEQHRAQMDEKNSRIDEQLCAFETEMDELEARVELNRPGRATAVVGTIGEHDDDDDNDDNDTIISQ
jgi:predicted  nucleic acid-binding Zn-ribbon protein